MWLRVWCWFWVLLLPVLIGGLAILGNCMGPPDWYPTDEKQCRIAAESIAISRRDHPDGDTSEGLARAEGLYSRFCPIGYPIPDLSRQ